MCSNRPLTAVHYEYLAWSFGAFGVSLLGVFFFYPFREKQFDDFVQLSASQLELGKIVIGEQGTGEFSLMNRTQHKIPFTLSADCSCTVIEPKSGVLDPMSSARVHVKYKPKAIPVSEFSLHHEESDITVSLLAKDRRLDRFVSVRAQSYIPAKLDPLGFRCTVEPFRQSTIAVMFTISEDVDSVRVKSSPSFLGDLELIRNGTQVELRGRVDKLQGIHQGEVQIEFVVRAFDKPVLVNMPVLITVENPFEIESNALVFYPGSNTKIQLTPKFGVAKVEFVRFQSDLPIVSAEVDEPGGQTLTILCHATGESNFPVTGTLNGMVRVTRQTGEELLFKEFLHFVVAEGGLLDH